MLTKSHDKLIPGNTHRSIEQLLFLDKALFLWWEGIQPDWITVVKSVLQFIHFNFRRNSVFLVTSITQIYWLSFRCDLIAFFHRSSLFHEETEEFEGVVTLLELVRYISDICVLGQQMDDSHNLLIHINLNFMELVSRYKMKGQS